MSVIDIVARLKNEASGPAKELAGDLGKIDDATQKGAVNLGSLASGAAALGVAMGPAIAGIGLMGAGLNYSIGQAAEAEQANAALEQTVKSMGGASGLTADQLRDMAGGLQEVTTFGDETIMRAESLLLTFGNINSSVFPETLSLSLDMAQVFGSVDSAAIGLGKALNDFDGFTALKRQGVSFSETQLELIKQFKETGDMAAYQELVLGTLNEQFGGQAQAAAATYAGRIEQLKNQFGEAGEAVGAGLLPGLTELGEEVLPVVIDQVEELSIVSAERLQPAFEDLIETGRDLSGVLSGVGFDSTTFWDSMGEEIARVNEKILLTQGYIELIRRPSGARWDIVRQFGDVGREAETAGERVEGYRLVLDRLEIQQGEINEEIREGKDAVLAQGNAYDYLIPKVEAVTTATQATSGAYDYMIDVSIRNENRMEAYGERLDEVDEGQEEATESARALADAIGTIVAEAMSESIGLSGNLFTATNNLKVAQEELAASPWSQELVTKVETAEGEVSTAFDAIKESHRQMVVDILIQQAELEGGFTTSQANIMVAMGLMSQEEAEMALQSQETARQVGTVGAALLKTFLEDGVISRQEADLLEQAIGRVEEGSLTASDVLTGLAQGGLAEVVVQSDNAYIAADRFYQKLLETEGDYNATVNVSYNVTNEPPPGLGGGAVGGANAGGGSTGNPFGGPNTLGGGNGFIAGPGNGFSATSPAIGGGNTYYITIDARGAAAGVDESLRRVVEEVVDGRLARDGRQAEILWRTR